ncbi:MAG: DUF6701 domain-containing protein [Sulfuricaulis sp.]
MRSNVVCAQKMLRPVAAKRFSRNLPILVCAAMIVLVFMGFADRADAALKINSITLNGASSVTVAPGATITVVVNGTTTGTTWGSTHWVISTSPPGTWAACDPAPTPSDTLSGTYNVTLAGPITAPAVPGTYTAYFQASSNASNCGNTTSPTFPLANTNSVIVVAAPTATTNAATAVTSAGATLNGTVNANGLSTTVSFDYGLTTGYGTNVAATPSPVSGYANTGVSYSVTGLSCGTLYHFRVNGVNSSGTTHGGDLTITTVVCPAVTSMNLASTNPAYAGTAVSWTVVFNTAVTGVAVSDFQLVPGGGVSGASITSVTGIGTTYTVTANSGTSAGTLGLNLVDDDSITDAYGTPLGGVGAGNGNFSGQVYTISPPFCSPPSNIPAGVTVSCECDQFARASLNPSTIFGGNWAVSSSSGSFTPSIDTTNNLLELTQAVGSEATAATVPGIFPAAGNYISVEFRQYAYGSTSNPTGPHGADGIAVTLSDYSVPAVPGAFGGSLGFAQKDNAACTSPASPPCNGFAGGWVGIGLDDFGNYENGTEGRYGGYGAGCAYPTICTTAYPESVGVRGSGSGLTGYNWLGGNTSAGLIDNASSTTASYGYYYQVIVDATNYPTGTAITVNRDTTGTGTAYTQLVNIPNVYNISGITQAPVPANWQISFTGSTGGSNNIHEIGGLRICASTIVPPTGGTASGFSAIDSAYSAASGSTVPAYQNFQTGHIYMKLVSPPAPAPANSFNLWVAALSNNGLSTTYTTTSNKYAQVKLVDNSGNICGPDSARTCGNSSCYTAPAVETGASQVASFLKGNNTGVASPSPSFTLYSAWKDLVAVVRECNDISCGTFTATAPACSADSFSVRPTSITSVTSPNATNTSTSGTPTFIAGTGNFSLTATVGGGGYTGVPQINSASVSPVGPATVAGALAGTFAAATSGSGSSTATGTTFTYSEVGAFQLLGPDFTVPRIPGVYDTTWTAIDSDPTKNDCNTGISAAAYSNTLDANGKYGCYFGITATAGGFGRFIPAYFNVTSTVQGCTTFTYSGQPFAVTVTPFNGLAANTKNYTGALAKQVTIAAPSGTANFLNNTIAAAAFLNVSGTIQGSTNLVTNSLSGANPPMTYTFPVPQETPPLALTLRASDTDSVSSLGHTEGSTTIDSGRIHLLNAYGSELADLLMPMQVEYYSGASNGWIANGSDTCSAVVLKALSYQTLPTGTTCVQDTGNPGVSGQGCATAGPVSEGYLQYPNLTNPNPITNTTIPIGSYDLYLKAPGTGNYGSVNVTASLASTMPWLEYNWKGTGTPAIEPTGQAIFGQYRGSPRNIYLREIY